MTQPVLNAITRPDAFDSWGPLTLPTSTGKVFTTLFPRWGKGAGELSIPPSDVCLAACLDFIATFVDTDGQATVAWGVSAEGGEASSPLKTIWLHDPREVDFNSKHLPALYLWRESSKSEWIADDYLRDNTVVKGLWIFPIPGGQDKQRKRFPYPHALCKAIETGIERGRTPSWKQPGDTDRLTPGQGSLFYLYAGFDEFALDNWRKIPIVIKNADAGGDYFGIELTFRLVECHVYGVGRSPPFYPDTGMTGTLQEADSATFDGAVWAPLTLYGPTPIVQPTTPNGSFYVGAFANTRSGATEPNFPTTPGATVADGSQVWTCVGPVNGTRITGPFETPV